MKSPLLKLVNVSTGYNGSPVLVGVNFELGENEKLVVMGPNGSGKSTLLKTIIRLIEPLSGSIVFRGVDITKLPEKELPKIRTRIGYLPQGNTLFPHMRAIDNVMLPLRLVLKMKKEEAEKRAHYYLSLLGASDIAKKYPAELSGGQRQRVALARALATDPDLLLLDEPTASLDPESRLDVLEMLRDVAKLGKSMIVVTHEVDFAKNIADRVLVVHGGVVKYLGPYSESVVESLMPRAAKGT